MPFRVERTSRRRYQQLQLWLNNYIIAGSAVSPMSVAKVVCIIVLLTYCLRLAMWMQIRPLACNFAGMHAWPHAVSNRYESSHCEWGEVAYATAEPRC